MEAFMEIVDECPSLACSDALDLKFGFSPWPLSAGPVVLELFPDFSGEPRNFS
jgi:hypothetical protein